MAYYTGTRLTAVRNLKCHLTQTLVDPEARILASDIFWWEGYTQFSEHQAALAVKSKDYSLDYSTEQRLTHRLSRWKVLLEGSYIGSEISKGFGFETQTHYRYYKKNTVGLGYNRPTRLFDNGIELTDDVFSLFHSLSLSKKSYFETELSYSPTPSFKPLWQVSLTPHYVFENGIDTNFLVRMNRYEDRSLNTLLAPGIHIPLSSSFALAARTFLSISSQSLLFSGWGGLDFTPITRLKFQLGFSKGKSQEDFNLVEDFTEFQYRVKLSLIPHFAVSPGIAVRMGDRREEMQFHLGMEWLF